MPIPRKPFVREFNVRDYGAVGDGVTADHAAIQRAIDEAAASGGRARVLVPGGRRYLIGSLTLRGGIEFHLADDAHLLASAELADYGLAAPPDGDVNPVAHTLGLLSADGGEGLSITGTGTIDGRSQRFMTDSVDEWRVPQRWRPRVFLLSRIRGLEISGITIRHSPSWTVHLLGCEDVLVDRLTIENELDVPNCDGINPDHCRRVEISNCTIRAGDDAIVVKTSRRGGGYGPTEHILVRDCVLESQSAAIKVGSESVEDLRHLRFERCRIKSGCRGLCIQLRDEGSISDVEFNDIAFTARYHSDSWWGLGEGISFTAIPREAGSALGRIEGVRVRNVAGRAENSLRVAGTAASRIRDVLFEQVEVTVDRWTRYVGGRWDNRPTSALQGIERHRTSAFALRFADQVAFRGCRVRWGERRPGYFGHALEAEQVGGLDASGLEGDAAHPARDSAIAVS